MDTVKMPTGTSGNSTLKSSFSLTSLRSFTPTDNPDHGTPLRLRNERLYHSLTKKSRRSNDQDKEFWRKSWGSGISQDGKEFWEGFQADYDYLMAQNLLEKTTVSDVTMEKVQTSAPTAPPVWTHSEFMDHFAQFYSWLKGIQDSVYGKQENVTDWKLRAERQEDMRRQQFKLDTFNDQSKKLINRYPELEPEVSWLTKHINDKWETVEGMMGVLKGGEGDRKSETGRQEKVDHEIRCLRRWLRELDGKLKPLSFHQGWTRAELEMKTKEHMVLHRDIEAHRKIVSSVFKLCEKADTSTLLAARALERKYHEYYLRSLEWQYHIESLIGLQVNKSPPSWSNDSDGEPVAKIARFAWEKEPDVYRESNGGEILAKEDKTIEEIDFDMDVAPSEATFGKHFGNMENADSNPGNDSILRVEDFSLETTTTFGTKSRNFGGLSCGREGDVEAATPKIVNGLPAKSWTGAPPSTRLGSDVSETFRETPVDSMRAPKTRPPNTGTFSWKHSDTDSDQEKVKMSEEHRRGKDEIDGKDGETTSSEDWTYAAGAEKPSKSVVRSLNFAEGNETKTSSAREMKYFSARNIPKMNSVVSNKEPISPMNRKLLEEADELFKCKRRPLGSKHARMKLAKDGEKETPLDSCDASGEYTEDSDEREALSSEDNDSSTVTCRRSESAEGILDEGLGDKPEVVLRKNKSSAMRNRPWSMSNVSLLSRNSRGFALKSRSFMSESALNQMLGSLDKAREYCSTLRNGRTVSTEDGTWGSCGSSRKRRTKTRKRLNKRSNSGSDNVTLSGSDSANLSSSMKPTSSLSGIVKSRSFSNVPRKQKDFSPAFTKCESGTETDEEPRNMSLPRFRLGPKAGTVTVSLNEGDKFIQTEEQLSLNSDQASWDNYQEKYQSEAYSEEPADSETAKKLLEFGEDYGKFLGNQSDTPSSWSRSVKTRSRCKFDSDSDVDEVKRLLRQSIDQLNLVGMKLNGNEGVLIDVNGEDSISKTFLDEIIATCRRHVDCLTKLLNEVNDEMHIIPNEQNFIQNIIERWEDIETTAEFHKAEQLRNEMAAIKNELLNWAVAIESMEKTVATREELDEKIAQIKNELNSMKVEKKKLIQANASVHRFLATAKHGEGEATLRDEVIELYHVWDQTFCRVSSELCYLQSLSQAWHDFDDHLSQLQCALRTDTLKVLDIALQCGTSDVAGSLKDVAGFLSDKEKEATSKEAMSTMQEQQSNLDAIPRPLLTALTTEGSLSDSGISDSGSEQEMSEREKRLAQIKRLAKRLESILAPSSQALINMFERIEEAESGLRKLQKTCRDLIVRSSSNSEEFKMIVSKASDIGALNDATNDESKSLSEKPSSLSRREKGKMAPKSGDSTQKIDTESGEREGGKGAAGSGKSWLWRLFRFALPFQLALVALLWVACMMEPRCCDSFNNLELSLNPRLRYDSGPPPV